MRRYGLTLACMAIVVITAGCPLHVHLGGTYYKGQKVEGVSFTMTDQEFIDWKDWSAPSWGMPKEQPSDVE